MTLTGHAIVGAMLAARITDPVLLGAAGVGSHFALDVLPHWDFGTHFKKKSIHRLVVESFFDVVVGWGSAYLLYFYLLGGESWWLLILGVLTAQLPDWVTAPYHFFKWRFPPFSWVERLSELLHNTLDKPWGIVTQVGAILIMYYVLFIIS